MNSTKHILVIEDDQNLAILLDHMLSKQYQVNTFADGHSALNWMATGYLPDLIIADVDMPGMESTKLLENLQVSGFYRHIPVVIMSGKSDEEKASRLLGKGAQVILVKPFAKEELFGVLHKFAPVF
jgi:two-component system, chemotaxis family, chemotaxis protein CheY